MPTPEAIPLRRDCPAVLIPSGEAILLPAGEEVTITQSLGGAFTILTARGCMARIEAKNADALGQEPAKSEAAPAAGSRGPVDEKLVWDQLKTCYDPEIPVNIVELGLIYDLKIEPLPEGGNRVGVKMTLTAPGCGMGPVLQSDVEQKLLTVPGVTDTNVQLVWDPPWGMHMMSEAAQLQLGLM